MKHFSSLWCRFHAVEFSFQLNLVAKASYFPSVMESSSSVPRLYNCCFVFSLRRGVLTFGVFEAIFWFLATIVAIYSEVRYMMEIELYGFTDYIYEYDWYYYFVFWHPRDEYTETLRSNFINSINIFFLFLDFIIKFNFLSFSSTIFIPIKLHYTAIANIIVLNLLLALFFLFYFVFTLLLIIGIFKVSKDMERFMF